MAEEERERGVGKRTSLVHVLRGIAQPLDGNPGLARELVDEGLREEGRDKEDNFLGGLALRALGAEAEGRERVRHAEASFRRKGYRGMLQAFDERERRITEVLHRQEPG